MGPRLFRRGNFIPQGILGTVPARLQWGHAFSDVEILPTLDAFESYLSGFNGATPFQTWK